MRGTYLFRAAEAEIAVLISYVRPTSDSEEEETKGDTSGVMAPPPVPPAKKVRNWFGLSLLCVQTLTCPRAGLW
jgi:hypothetical protein